MSKAKDLTNQRFYRLTPICPIEKRTNACIVWLCRCDCGNLTKVKSNNLLSGQVKSCGCLNKEIRIELNFKHGDAVYGKMERLYIIWSSMKTRCLNSKDHSYKYYGGRNISICNEWIDSYSVFKHWALANGYDGNLTIDRINHKGNYEPDNCQWLTKSENSRKAHIDRGL